MFNIGRPIAFRHSQQGRLQLTRGVSRRRDEVEEHDAFTTTWLQEFGSVSMYLRHKTFGKNPRVLGNSDAGSFFNVFDTFRYNLPLVVGGLPDSHFHNMLLQQVLEPLAMLPTNRGNSYQYLPAQAIYVPIGDISSLSDADPSCLAVRLQPLLQIRRKRLQQIWKTPWVRSGNPPQRSCQEGLGVVHLRQRVGFATICVVQSCIGRRVACNTYNLV